MKIFALAFALSLIPTSAFAHPLLKPGVDPVRDIIAAHIKKQEVIRDTAIVALATARQMSGAQPRGIRMAVR